MQHTHIEHMRMHTRQHTLPASSLYLHAIPVPNPTPPAVPKVQQCINIEVDMCRFCGVIKGNKASAARWVAFLDSGSLLTACIKVLAVTHMLRKR